MARRGTAAKIDLHELEKLCMMQATDEEVAAWFAVSVRTIERRRKNPKFEEVMTRGKAKGRLSVRRWQMKLLEAGNATMGVWLGKQLLGQVDHIDHRLDELTSVLRVIVIPRGGGPRADFPSRSGNVIDLKRSAYFSEPPEEESESE
jgi:hypothetical protein